MELTFENENRIVKVYVQEYAQKFHIGNIKNGYFSATQEIIEDCGKCSLTIDEVLQIASRLKKSCRAEVVIKDVSSKACYILKETKPPTCLGDIILRSDILNFNIYLSNLRIGKKEMSLIAEKMKTMQS